MGECATLGLPSVGTICEAKAAATRRRMRMMTTAILLIEHPPRFQYPVRLNGDLSLHVPMRARPVEALISSAILTLKLAYPPTNCGEDPSVLGPKHACSPEELAEYHSTRYEWDGPHVKGQEEGGRQTSTEQPANPTDSSSTHPLYAAKA